MKENVGKSTYVPSKPRTESSASRGSSNSTKAKPGGFRATHTFLMLPYLENTFSISYLDAFVPRLPTYTLQERSHSRYRDIWKAEKIPRVNKATPYWIAPMNTSTFHSKIDGNRVLTFKFCKLNRNLNNRYNQTII